MRTADGVPGSVRLAGGLVAAQGLAGLAFGVALLIRAIDGASTPGNNLYGQAGYFGVLFGAVLGCGIGLLLGRRGVRVPAVVINILLLGVAWYAAVPSGRPAIGIPVAALCVLVLALLLGPRARGWAEDY